MSAVTIQQMADRVAQLLEERLGLGGRDLSAKLKRAGRVLPKKVRDAGRLLAQSAQKGQNPKLLGQIDMADFDAAAALMADPGRQVFATGGRITHAMADYFVTHMQVIRPGVSLIADMSNAWPPVMIDMKPGDVLLALDIRRYENNVLQLVEMAADQGAEVVLITDQWVSPAAQHARFRFSAHIEAPSAWDSTVSIQVLIETLMAAVQSLTWETTQSRMKRLEELYARSRFFRRAR